MSTFAPIRNPSAVVQLPPCDPDAEAAVLSAVMLEPTAFKVARGILAPEDFYAESHRRIFEACIDVDHAGQPIDAVTVAAHLRDSNRLAQVGGMAYLTVVINAAPALIERHLRAYCEIVSRHARTRSLISRFEKAALELRGGADADVVAESVQQAIAQRGGAA
jgi:replicative DNA helicase